jgi:DNA-binding CsgD family transcriptional regulator
MPDSPPINDPDPCIDAARTLRDAEDVVDALNRALAFDVTPRERATFLLREYQRLIGHDHDVQLILHDELHRPAGPRVMERVVVGPQLEALEPRTDADVQAIIDAAAPAGRIIVGEAIARVRRPHVFVVPDDLPEAYGEQFQRDVVVPHLKPRGWTRLMIGVWASSPDRMVGLTTYGDGGRQSFDANDRRLASLMLRAIAPVIYREMLDHNLMTPDPATRIANGLDEAQQQQLTLSPLQGRDLSSRQLDVLRLLLRGHSEKEVARDLSVSTHTVHTHVKRLYGEFDVSSRGELLALFIDQRVLAMAS